MGYLHADWLLPYLRGHDDDDELETGPIGTASLVQRTTAVKIEIDGDHVIYGDEIDVDFGGWGRKLGPKLVKQRHDWLRLECHASDRRIKKGDGLVVAEFPFGGRRRYRCTTFRPALTKNSKPHFSDEYKALLRKARKDRRTDLVTLAIHELENPNILPKDPFNTGSKKRVAGVLPSEPFTETYVDSLRPARKKGQKESAGHEPPSEPETLAGWAIGTCRTMVEAHRLVVWGLLQRLQVEADRQAKSDGSASDGELRFAYPPVGTFPGRRRLTGSTPNQVNELFEHVAWVAMAGPGLGEPMPEDRSVAQVAFRRLNDLLYNHQRREDNASRPKQTRTKTAAKPKKPKKPKTKAAAKTKESRAKAKTAAKPKKSKTETAATKPRTRK